MTDLLVKLYELPPLQPAHEAVADNSITIRRALVPERSVVIDWVASRFSRPWADECRVATSRHPVSCFVATTEKDGAFHLLGFACYNATYQGFFGPIGVDETHRGKGIGSALTLTALHAMRNEGFAYAVIGAAKDAAWFHEVAGATVIERSSPGPYRGMIR